LDGKLHFELVQGIPPVLLQYNGHILLIDYWLCITFWFALSMLLWIRNVSPFMIILNIQLVHITNLCSLDLLDLDFSFYWMLVSSSWWIWYSMKNDPWCSCWLHLILYNLFIFFKNSHFWFNVIHHPCLISLWVLLMLLEWCWHHGYKFLGYPDWT
jgi:hypothetical protein